MDSKQFHVLIYHCFLMGNIPFKQSNGFKSVTWTLLLSTTTIKCWFADFKHGCTDTNDADHSELPNVNHEKIEKTLKIIMSNRKVKL